MSFDLDRLISDCTSAAAESTPAKAVRDIITGIVSDPAAVTRTAWCSRTRAGSAAACVGGPYCTQCDLGAAYDPDAA